jgi:hypothetical protein
MKKQGGLTLSRQKGQAILLVLLLAVAAVLIGLSLANTGILTSEKMQLQNAADATAYSISTVEARDLNFSAYTNRAMIANEVAIAQMAGLMSHGSMITSIPAWLDFYFTVSGIYAIPVVGQVIKGIVQGIATGGGSVKRTAAKILRIPTMVFAEINKVYSASQRVMHFGTLYFTTMTIWEVPGKNIDDSRYSVFGYLALFRHLTTYYPDLRLLSPGKETFVTSYRESTANYIPHSPLADKPTEDAQKAGMERLAAMVNASRDPYSIHRQCSGQPIYGKRGLNVCNEEYGGWALPLFPPIHVKINVNLGLVRGSAGFDFELDLRRHGGTDLRYRTSGKGKKKEQHYIWTASDQVGMSLRLGVFVFTELWTPWGYETILNISPSFTVSAPFGVGGGQVASTAEQVNPITDMSSKSKKTFMLLANPLGGPFDKLIKQKLDWKKQKLGQVEVDFYGNNPGFLPTIWLANGSPVPVPYPPNALAPDWAVAENNLYTKYSGLPRYNDTKRGADPIQLGNPAAVSWGLAAPYILVALEKDIDDIYQSNTEGRFKLEPNAAGDKIAAIGKAEVYFSRPNDLSYYRRADGKTELSNAFNPYWDARLVDTSYIDRTLALSIDQQQWWVSQDIQSALSSLNGLLNAVKNMF